MYVSADIKLLVRDLKGVEGKLKGKSNFISDCCSGHLNDAKTVCHRLPGWSTTFGVAREEGNIAEKLFTRTVVSGEPEDVE